MATEKRHRAIGRQARSNIKGDGLWVGYSPSDHQVLRNGALRGVDAEHVYAGWPLATIAIANTKMHFFHICKVLNL